MEHPKNPPPHVLILPLPAQGHITPMLNLSELLCIANIQVTFLIAEDKYQLLTQHSTIHTRFDRYPGFRFITIPQAPPNGNPKPASHDVIGLISARTEALALTGAPILRQLLMESKEVTCFIIDGLLSFAYDIANEAKVPVVVFKVVSAACIWADMCIPKLVEAGELPIKDEEEMDQLVKNVPGMSSFIRYRDLPSFCRVRDKSSCFNLQQVFAGELERTKTVHSLILNTFEDLEGPILSEIRSQYQHVYAIGPLHEHLQYRFSKENLSTSKNSSSSLWEVDQGCISWLNQKPDKSVVYVSFGSTTNLTTGQFIEIWAGLVQSNKYFLWVVRPDAIIGSGLDSLSSHDELLEGTEKRGCMVTWAPQNEVLAHRAVGGFFTHSGWNSTQESIIAGVPMLCWPYYGDQQVNSRFVSEVWRIGLDMKDTCDRTIVENMINDLMDGRKDQLRKSTDQMSQLARQSISEGGSSYSNLNQLIEDIKAIVR